MNKIYSDIAIVGMAGRFPGAKSISEFWNNLCDGVESQSQLSDSELIESGVCATEFNDKQYVRSVFTLDGYDEFDPAFFQISPLEAELMDPQLRQLLECGWEAMEHAGYKVDKPRKVGVFTGSGGVTSNYLTNYINVHEQFERLTAGPTHLANDKDFLSTYLSYKLNLTGPSVTVQTACSTSLVAVHQACNSLFNDECEMALAGGVTIRVPQHEGYKYKEGYIFSKEGRVRSFDSEADGVVFGSGLGLVLLKKLDDAVVDGDTIHAIIKGTSISNDGKSKMSFAASSARGQIECISDALSRSGVGAETIDFVESHGTGTAMGDPEEVKALSSVFKKHSDKKQYCALGAVKTNIGHLEAAAGIVSLIKSVLVIKSRLVPPTINYRTPNSRIKFESTPFFVNDKVLLLDKKERPVRAAVNCLGIGGTNAFAILEEWLESDSVTTSQTNNNYIIPISAKSETQLRELVVNLYEFLTKPNGLPSGPSKRHTIENIAFTLQFGRLEMSKRLAFVVPTKDALLKSLKKYIDRIDDSDELVIRANDNDRQELLKLDNANGSETKLLADAYLIAKKWANGLPVEWNELSCSDSKSNRVPLPSYPFNNERYWVPKLNLAKSEPPNIHPLLHKNTSLLDGQSYECVFSGDEFFLVDHKVKVNADDTVKSVLPGVAYLEMARAAIANATKGKSIDSTVEIRDVVWRTPIVVVDQTRVRIHLFESDTMDGSEAISFEVCTENNETEIVHCQGSAVLAKIASPGVKNISDYIRSFDNKIVGVNEAYSQLKKLGLSYGMAHRGIKKIFVGKRTLVAEVALPDCVSARAREYDLHPSIIDSALQATIFLDDAVTQATKPPVPFSLQKIRILGPSVTASHVVVKSNEHDGQSVNSLSVELFDKTGSLLVEMTGFVSRTIGGKTEKLKGGLNKHGRLIARPVWEHLGNSGLFENRSISKVKTLAIDFAESLELAAKTTFANNQFYTLQTKATDSTAKYEEIVSHCFSWVKQIMSEPDNGVQTLHVVMPWESHRYFQAGVMGLMNTVMAENPMFSVKLSLLSIRDSVQQLINQCIEEQWHPSINTVRVDGDSRYGLYWQELTLNKISSDRSVYKESGVYLITGGLGGLGQIFVEDILINSAQAKVIVTGRSAPDDQHVKERLSELVDSNSDFTKRLYYRQVKLDVKSNVDALVKDIESRIGSISGVLHCAGAVSDSFIIGKTSDEFSEVLQPKVIGCAYLDEATKSIPLDFFALFSSLSAITGNIGQADYAAANGFLDDFAVRRNEMVRAGSRQGFSCSINWPLWKDGGMGQDGVSQLNLHETTGIIPISKETGVETFHRALAQEYERLVILEGDSNRITRVLPTLTAIDQPETMSDSERLSLPQHNEANATTANGSVSQVAVEKFLGNQFADLLKLKPHQIDGNSPLEDYGINSILALDMTKILEQSFGPIPKTLFFEYLTIADLAQYFIRAHSDTLRSLLGSSAMNQPIPQKKLAQIPAVKQLDKVDSKRRRRRERSTHDEDSHRSSEDIAIVGLSGRYPESYDIGVFWENLRDGKDCVVEVPSARWAWQDFYTEDRTLGGHHYSKWGGFIDGVDEFDARFFNIAPVEAERLDPQERLFLQHSWSALEDAGLTRSDLQNRDINSQMGVYAGVMYNEYQLFGAQASERGQSMGFASNPASIANRVSYVLNVTGPSMVVDTMCSSSLTAIHIACQDLKSGKTKLAIAGGVNISVHPNKYLMLSSGQFISSDGQCQSFGEGGGGYIPGEGVGVVVLKTLSEALRDSHQIYGVIKGSALSHGGKTNGFTVPNPNAQAIAVRSALDEAGINPREISYIEAHGTGTKLGDPIEIAGLNKVFLEDSSDFGYCKIGSAKSNIGHAEAAAGIAGLTKVLLQMKHRKIVPSLHSSVLNPNIDFENSPFEVNQTLVEWEKPLVNGLVGSRIAGISSFGAGGSNAHIVVEEFEHESVAAIATPRAPQALILSARTNEQLQLQAKNMFHFLQSEENINLNDLAFTLQVGREAMEFRLGVEAESVEQFSTRLGQYLDDTSEIPSGVYVGSVKDNKETISLFRSESDLKHTVDAWLDSNRFASLMQLWVKGLNVTWNDCYGAGSPMRMSLPTYPFEKRRFWWDDNIQLQPAAGVDGSSYVHPLLHKNVSSFSKQCYKSKFTIRDLQSLDKDYSKTEFPTFAQLEMARAAVADATDIADSMVVLNQVKWGEHYEVGNKSELFIELVKKSPTSFLFEIYSYAESDQSIERIHCQGQAEVAAKESTELLDIESIKSRLGLADIQDKAKQDNVYCDENEILIDIQLAGTANANNQNYLIQTSVLNAVLNRVSLFLGIHDGNTWATSSLKQIFLCSHLVENMFIWALRTLPRSGRKDVFDVVIADSQGMVCLKIKSLEIVDTKNNLLLETPVKEENFTAASSALTRRNIDYVVKRNSQYQPLNREPHVGLKKPKSVSLAAPVSSHNAVVSLERRTLALPEIVRDRPIEQSSFNLNKKRLVLLYERGQGVYELDLAACADHQIEQQCEEFISALGTLNLSEQCKVVVIKANRECFLKSTLNNGDNSFVSTCNALIDCSIVTVMDASDGAEGMLLSTALLCDFFVLSKQSDYGIYSSGKLDFDVDLERLIAVRLNARLTHRILNFQGKLTGQELAKLGWTCPIIDKANLSDYVDRFALSLADKTSESISVLKVHLNKVMRSALRQYLEITSDHTDTLEEPHSSTVIEPKNIEFECASLRCDRNTAYVTVSKASEFCSIASLVSNIENIFKEIEANSALTSVVLRSELHQFFPKLTDDQEILSLISVVQSAPLATLFVLDDSDNTETLMVAQFADYCLYNEDGNYCFSSKSLSLPLTRLLMWVYQHRFGNKFGAIATLTESVYSGKELLSNVPTLSVVAKTLTSEYINQFQTLWGNRSAPSVRRWKHDISSQLQIEQTRFIGDGNFNRADSFLLENDEVTQADNEQYKSEVVEVSSPEVGVFLIRMKDEASKNLFTDIFSQNLTSAFKFVNSRQDCRVVVLTGFGNYFASGGTQSTLRDIYEGHATFTDNRVFELPRLCKVPVIAALQGHAIGAGWVLGMGADITFLSDESVYKSPYMSYGFTPGAGSTYVFPKTIGLDLAHETLFTAGDYSGSLLARRNTDLSVLPRGQVLNSALSLATEMAHNERSVLVSIKQQWNTEYGATLEGIYQQEIDMHEQTFVGKKDTWNRIQANFAEPNIDSGTTKQNQLEFTRKIDSRWLESDVSNILKSKLAEELRLDESEISPDTQFIDLGLDSITGVTWIRNINEALGTQIEAVKVYSYPTLAELSRYVHSETDGGEAPSYVKTDTILENSQQSSTVVVNSISQTEIENKLKELLSDELRMDVSEIGNDMLFVDLGLDSITGVTWLRHINDFYGTDIEAVKVYSFPTLAELSRLVADSVELASPAIVSDKASSEIKKIDVTENVGLKPNSLIDAIPHATPLESIRVHRSENKLASVEPIAVIGMAGQLPMAENLDQYWENIISGKNCISEVSNQRWNIDEYFQAGEVTKGKTYSRWVGALEDYDRFDSLFFNISPREAKNMDPQQRLFLQSCWHAIEDAGYNPLDLSGQHCGVYVGCSTGDYHQQSFEEQWSGTGFTGAATSILAARISYHLNLLGPSLSIDTACSSSLVAISSACDSLVSGGCDTALAGGVNVLSGPAMHVMTSQVGMLSPDGQCFTFDERANGIVLGEAVGVIVLKRLSDAEKAGDNIVGLIEGWGVNQDGKTNGITAPDADSQKRLQQNVYQRFGVDPGQIELLEAHGTGTKLGDPIEVMGLKESFSSFTDNKNYCALGSVKANIGHCLAAAGITGFLKLMLALKNRQLPPSINFEKVNSHIDLEGTPFYINKESRDWITADKKRMAAISSFGFSGTNAHIVVGECNEIVDQIENEGTRSRMSLIPLSAKTPEQLNELVSAIFNVLDKSDDLYKLSPRLEDIAYTLLVGRQSMEYRLVIQAESVSHLKSTLAQISAGNRTLSNVYQTDETKVDRGHLSLFNTDSDFTELVNKWVINGKLAKLAELWVNGIELDWSGLFAGLAPKRISLPGYPFAKERHWIDDQTSISYKSLANPLLQSNTSDLSQISYSSKFSGTESFLETVSILDVDSTGELSPERKLPELLFLEMVRAAVFSQWPLEADQQKLVISDLVWSSPVQFAVEQEVCLALWMNSDRSIDFELYPTGDVSLDDAPTDQYYFHGRARVDFDVDEQLVEDNELQSVFAGLDMTEQCSDQVIFATENKVLVSLERLSSDRMIDDLTGRSIAVLKAIDLGYAALELPKKSEYDHFVVGQSVEYFLDFGRACFVYIHSSQRTVTVEILDNVGVVVSKYNGLKVTQYAHNDQDHVTQETYVEFAHSPIENTGVTLIKPSSATTHDDNSKSDFSPIRLENTENVTGIVSERKVYQTISKPVVNEISAVKSELRDNFGDSEKWTLEIAEKSLRLSLASALLIDKDSISSDDTFVELGLDSIVGVEWVHSVNGQFHINLSATEIYDYPTLALFATHVMTLCEAVQYHQSTSKGEVDIEPKTECQTLFVRHSIDELEQHLKSSLAETLLIDNSAVLVDQSFTSLGMDSIVGVEWVNSINTGYELSLPATIVYDYPDIHRLATYILELLAEELPSGSAIGDIVSDVSPVMDTEEESTLDAKNDVEDYLTQSLATLLLIDTKDISASTSFVDLGLDSIIGVEWVKSINESFDLILPATSVYDYASIASLSTHIADLVSKNKNYAPSRVSKLPLLGHGIDSTITVKPVIKQTYKSAIKAPLSKRITQHFYRFSPQYGSEIRELYFHSTDCIGNYETDGYIEIYHEFDSVNTVSLQEHVVFDQHILPTDAYIELIYTAFRTYFASKEICLRSLDLISPLVVKRRSNVYVRLVFRRSSNGCQISIESSSMSNFENYVVNAKALLIGQIPGEYVVSRFSSSTEFVAEKHFSGSELTTNNGHYYAPLEKLSCTRNRAVGVVSTKQHKWNFLTNPFAIYGALGTVINFAQFITGVSESGKDDYFLPRSIESFQRLSDVDCSECFCYVELLSATENKVDCYLELLNEQKKIIAKISKITLVRASRQNIQNQIKNIENYVSDNPVNVRSVPDRSESNLWKNDDIAIVGMSCRFPQCDSIDEFWNALKSGQSCITEVPSDRWVNYENWYNDDPNSSQTSFSKWGGFINDVAQFDPLFFGISPAEAEIIEPQQRQFLQESWRAIESAGYAPSSLSGTRCGVYVGCAGGDYIGELVNAQQDQVGAAFMGTSTAILAARIAYHLNLKGPALSIDTACSSSLVAVHLACDGIRSGQIDSALAGGVNLLTTPRGHVHTSQVGMLSPTGQCAAFDESADGIVFSEGCSAIMLKSLEQAEKDNDFIWGVIKGSGMNQDGKTNGITAPSSIAQKELITQTYQRFDIDPGQISYVEAHGTGTPLGDPIEVNALSDVFRADNAKSGSVAIGSVKSNIGHSGFAAGMAGMIKILLCMHHGKLVPSIHYEKPNLHLNLDQSPFRVSDGFTPWNTPGSRMACVSSFGFSGTNAHIVIEEHVASKRPESTQNMFGDQEMAVVLSAKTPEQLDQQILLMRNFVKEHSESLDLKRFAYTLQVGRDAMDERIGFLVSSVSQLLDKLSNLVQGEENAIAHFRSSDIQANSVELSDSGSSQFKNMRKWVEGKSVDWQLLYAQGLPRRMALPTYPFADEHYWVEVKSVNDKTVQTNQPIIHPLLHRNVSDFTSQQYESILSCNEIALDHHRVNGMPVLPAVAYLEILRAAVSDATGGNQRYDFQHVAWIEPLMAESEDMVFRVVLETDDMETIRFKVVSDKDELVCVHCQGQLSLVEEGDRLVADVGFPDGVITSTIDPIDAYKSFSTIGIDYGDAFRGMNKIGRITNGFVVELVLPKIVENTHQNFELNPSILDSAMQASICLVMDKYPEQRSTILPFALEQLFFHAPTESRMKAWVRYSDEESAKPEAPLIKVDIDLFSHSGQLCISMRGFSSRQIGNEYMDSTKADPSRAEIDSIFENTNTTPFEEEHYLSIIQRLHDNEISAEEAAEIG